MARGKSRFIVGLFVSLGLVIGMAALIWLGASRYFEAGTLYVTYFDESVQGLQVDSRVKYRGVDIGKVERIGVATDQKLVEVVFKVDLAGDLEKDIVTQLRAAGITGIVFIELDRRQEGHRTLLPPSEIIPPHPVIPSQMSQAKMILSSADRIMERLEKVDLGGISERVRESARAIETFFSNRQLNRLIANLEATATTLESSLRRIDGMLAAGTIETFLAEGREGLAEGRRGIAEVQRLAEEARELIAEARTEVRALKLGERGEQVRQLLEKLDRRTKRTTDTLETTTEEIRRGAESLQDLLERLRETPSDLIFSRPQAGDGQGEGN